MKKVTILSLTVLISLLLTNCTQKTSREKIAKCNIENYLSTYVWKNYAEKDCIPVKYSYGYNVDNKPTIRVTFNTKITCNNVNEVYFILDSTYQVHYTADMPALEQTLNYLEEEYYNCVTALEEAQFYNNKEDIEFYTEASQDLQHAYNYMNEYIEYLSTYYFDDLFNSSYQIMHHE